MKELLKQWAELEPARCRVGAVWLEMETADSRFWTMVQLADLETSTANDIPIQDAIQRAIVARGWGYRLEYWPQLQKHIATIWHPTDPAFKADGGAEDGRKLRSAAALLTAYVQALHPEEPPEPVEGLAGGE